MADVRLIDANALPMYKVKIVHSFGIVEGSVVFPDDIKKAPTIDAVPVVRCRECRLWKPINNNYGKCPFLIGENQFTMDYHYCSLAEKMDGGAENGR